MSGRQPESLFDDDPPAAAASRRPLPVEASPEWIRLGRLLPARVHLGTSSWSFPGWRGIVWRGEHSEAQLARGGLAAYAAHPLLRAVGIDRSFYSPLAAAEFARYAAEVPDDFRFVVKAPSLIADGVLRGERGAPAGANPHFLDVAVATERFIAPALEGLGGKAGPLVFQLSPLPPEFWREPAAAHATIARIGEFLAALPREVAGSAPLYALELRNTELLTPRLVKAVREAGARLVVGLHPAMPPAVRQSAALRAMDETPADSPEWTLKGPLVVRWSLAAHLRYQQAKDRYSPFDRLIDPDIVTRGTLAHLVHVAIRSGQPSYVIANNKAEGSAPLSMAELARAVVEREFGARRDE